VFERLKMRLMIASVILGVNVINCCNCEKKKASSEKQIGKKQIL